jgi:hypothetical protein
VDVQCKAPAIENAKTRKGENAKTDATKGKGDVGMRRR